MKLLSITLLVSLNVMAQVDYRDMQSDRYWAEKEEQSKTKEEVVQNLEVCTNNDITPAILPQETHDLTFDACKNAILDAVDSGVSDKEIIDVLIKGEDGNLREKADKEKKVEGIPYVSDEIKG